MACARLGMLAGVADPTGLRAPAEFWGWPGATALRQDLTTVQQWQDADGQ